MCCRAASVPETQIKAAFRSAYDWKRMTEQDDAVWQEIFRTLDA